MSFKSFSFLCFSLLIFQQSFAQKNYDGYNRVGVTGGYSLFDINTSDLVTQQGEGFVGGFTTRGAFRNDFDLIFGISYFGASVGVQGSQADGTDTQFIEYKVQGAQLGIMGSYNIIMQHLSVEFGPILNANGKMELNSDRYEDYILTGYTAIKAQDIQDINRFNFRLAAGVTGGFRSIRLSAQYQYGVTNMLAKLNSNELESDNFNGHSSTIILSLVFYF